MKKKTKVIVSSALSIALCASMISGATFALFTDTAETNIAVTAGKVQMDVGIDGIQTWSLEDDKEKDGRTDGTFTQGGFATFANGTLTLDRIIPGDKVAFNIKGANTSNVTIQYRYIIECTEGYELMNGLTVTVNGVTYKSLASYKSAWATLAAENNMDDVAVSIELPAEAGNEYQTLSTNIKVTVEAIQGNADVTGETAVVEFLDGKVDLTDLIVTDSVVNYGDVELVGGIIDINDCGFDNFGNATLTDMTLNAGSASDYGFRASGAESVTVLNNIDFNSEGGGIGAADGAQVTMNSGSVDVSTTSTSGRYNIYAVGEGTVVTINDGEFSFSKTLNQKRAYAYVGEGATLYINGGIFGEASTRGDYTAGLMGKGTIVITGGTFGFDPTTWVADGCKVDKVDNTWTVSAITSADVLKNTLTAGSATLGADITLSNDALAVPAGVTATLNLGGHTLTVTNNTSAASCAIENKGDLTIINGTVIYGGVGDPNFGYGTNTINNSGKLTIDGATIINTTDSGSSNAIDNAPGAELIVNFGKIESQKVTIRLRDGSIATINGGEITGARAVQIHLFQSVDAETKLTINGGTFNGDYALYSYAYGNCTFAKTTVNISGGTFNGITAFGGGNKTATETVNITDGAFNGDLGRYLANNDWEDIAKPN